MGIEITISHYQLLRSLPMNPFRRFKFLSPCALFILTLVSIGRLTASPPTPNVLLITSEDNGPELGCYGDRFARTPQLDRLAAQGVRFERAFVATASCSESRAALLTGLYPHQNGQIGLATHHYRMFGELPNIASRLKARGYRTGIIGKLHVNPASAFPFDYRPDISKSNTFAHRDVGRVAELAGKFFSAADMPFFLMVNYADAHLPFLRQQHGSPHSPLSADDVRALPWIGIDTPRIRESQANYYNCIMRLDDGVGQLLTELDDAGLTEETLVIYLGDHGAQFPRGKLASYESSLHVPLIVRFPGRIPSGVVREELVSTLDLLPTILEAVGAQVSRELPGRSLLPLMSQQAGDWREFLFTEYHGHYPPIYFPQRTVRDGRYKLIVNLLQDRDNPVAISCSQMDRPPHPPYVTARDVATATEHVKQAYATWRDAPPVELYDLQTDPHEWQNRADEPTLADVKTRLLAELRRWQKRTDDPLADRAILDKLTTEHDAIERPYRRPKEPRWKYPDYLVPQNSKLNR